MKVVTTINSGTYWFIALEKHLSKFLFISTSVVTQVVEGISLGILHIVVLYTLLHANQYYRVKG